jgi:hypothetical protein
MSGCGVLKQLERNYWQMSRDPGRLNSITLIVAIFSVEKISSDYSLLLYRE